VKVGHDGLIYVPSAADGTVEVFALQPNQTLALLHTIHTGMPLDNISPDARGDLWVPGFPDTRQTMKDMAGPYNEISPATVFRIRKMMSAEQEDKLEYEVKKVIEDKEVGVINRATTVVHDFKSRRLFLGGAVALFIVICEPR
jgi:hypothetical protein